MAVNINGHDRDQLEILGVKFASDPRDIMTVAKLLHPNHPEECDVAALCKRTLSLHTNKFGQHADCSGTLFAKSLHCCSLDAHMHLFLCAKMMSQIEDARKSGELSSSLLCIGKEISLLHRTKCVCSWETGICWWAQGTSAQMGQPNNRCWQMPGKCRQSNNGRCSSCSQ